MRIWLHEVTGNDSGWNAWCLDHPGFATWAPTEGEVLSRVPAKFAEYLDWLDRHGMDTEEQADSIEVIEYVSGDEVLFSPDVHASEDIEIQHTLELLAASHEDLIGTVSRLPTDALDWDPPYRSFAEWATWRSVRSILAHIANTETHYYLPNVGYQSKVAPAAPEGKWETFLSEHRQETLDFITQLYTATDRSRVSRDGQEAWSVRKVLRRLIRHEILHWKSIRRIARDYDRLKP